MSPKVHFAVSLILGLIFGLIFQSYLIAILSLVMGWLVDCDHLLDYFLYLIKFKKKFNLKEFLSCKYFKEIGKVFLLAHAWEYLFLFLVLGFRKLSLPFVVAVGSSYGLHLLLDNFLNDNYPLMYFLFYRIKVGFNTEKLVKIYKKQKPWIAPKYRL